MKKSPEEILMLMNGDVLPPWDEVTQALEEAINRQPAPKPSPWDKVVMASEIARLETLHEFERAAKETAQKMNTELATLLKAHVQRTFKAMNFDLAKIPALIHSVRPWIAEGNQEAFDQLVADPGFEPALGIAIRALFLEVLDGKGAGPEQEKAAERP